MRIILTILLTVLSLVGMAQKTNHPYKSHRVVIGDISDSARSPVTVFITSTFLFFKKDTTPAFTLTYEDGDTRAFVVTDKLDERTTSYGPMHIWEVKENNGKISRLSILFSRDGSISSVALLTDSILLVFFVSDIPTLES